MDARTPYSSRQNQRTAASNRNSLSMISKIAHG
jgi:hypothetical protein